MRQSKRLSTRGSTLAKTRCSTAIPRIVAWGSPIPAYPLVASATTVTDKTVTFRPFPGKSFSLTGSDADAGVIGELERSGGQYQRDMASLLLRRLVPDAVVVDG